jgi:hypothetical protein
MSRVTEEIHNQEASHTREEIQIRKASQERQENLTEEANYLN